MKISYRLIIGGLVVLFLLGGYIDKTFFHLSGLKAVEKVFTAKKVIVKPSITPKQQTEKESQQGYQWAEDQDITDKAKCTQGSTAFKEGCATYVDDTANDALQDQDSANDQ